MVQNSLLNVLEIFFREPTTIHYIKEISKKIKLAPTSVRINIKKLEQLNLINKQKNKPFDGYIANRDNEDFLFYKRTYNFYSLKWLKECLVNNYFPKAIIVYGSYCLGEDTEKSDIDLIILTKTKKEINLKKFEEKLKRDIHIIKAETINQIEKMIKNKVLNGTNIYGGF